MSKLTLVSALTSSSQPAHPPAETTRSFSERPKRLRSASETLIGSRSGRGSLITKVLRSVAAIRKSLENESLALGQTGAQSPHSTQRPRSMATGSSVMAAVGQAATQALQPVAQAWGAMRGLPRKPTGIALRGLGMY